MNNFNFFADAPDFQAPADYIGGIILAIMAAFSGLGFIILAGCLIWQIISRNIAKTAGDMKKVQSIDKGLIAIILSAIALGIATPLMGIFAASMIGNDMGLGSATRSLAVVVQRISWPFNNG